MQMGPPLERGEILLARDRDCAVAMAAVSSEGDPAFWSQRELAEPAYWISSMARAEGHSGLGGWLLRWVTDAADAAGARWARLDARRDNTGLHAYYLRRGWRYKRTQEVADRYSGALFEKLALPDKAARAYFTTDVTLPQLAQEPVLVSLPAADMEIVPSRWDVA